MKKTFSILLTLALVLAFSLVAVTPVAAATTYYVATTGNNGNTGSSSSPWLTIQHAVSTAASGDTVMVAAGTYVEIGQIVINKNLTIVGAGAGSTIVNKAENTGDPYSGNNRGWVLVNASYTLSMSGLTLDGVGKQISIAILSFGTTTVQGCEIKNIDWSLASYYGRGVCLYGGTGNVVRNTVFSNIRRIGVFVFGSGVSALTEGNTYTGKGAIDCLDYGIEVGGGGAATITGNTITSCMGVASVDGSTSAGILVTTYFAAGTTATITGNTLTGNTEGIAVGYDGSDTSTVVAHYNNISGNTGDGIGTTAPTVDGRYNWWGANDGPGPVGPGTGDTVSANVNYDSWTTRDATSTGTGTASFTPSAGDITTGVSAVAEGSLPAGAQATKPINFPDGLFSFDITGLSNGQTVTVTITLPTGSAPTQYWKYHASEGGWIQIPMTVVGPPNVISITLVDGGLGDDDGADDGTIVDQGGPGNPGPVGWETYPISKVRVLLPWIALGAAIMAGVTLLVLRRRRAHS